MEMNGHESGKIQGDVISTPDSYSLLGCFISGEALYILVAYVCVCVWVWVCPEMTTLPQFIEKMRFGTTTHRNTGKTWISHKTRWNTFEILHFFSTLW